MILSIVQCDQCNRHKGTGNHWFKLRTGTGKLILTDWLDDSGEDSTTKHLCSDACVIKTVQGWLSTQKELSQKGEGL